MFSRKTAVPTVLVYLVALVVLGLVWAQRLKRVFSIDITTCAHCGGAVRIVASIEEPTAIRAILAHFEKHGALEQAHYRPAARAPPPAA